VISKEQLLKAALPEAEVDLPGRGAVRVRSLTRAEALRLNQMEPEDAEVYALTAGLVEPVLTDTEVRTLLEATGATELQPVVDAIMELSGMRQGAQFRGGTVADDRGPGPARLRPGQGTGDDPG
jgi:hypothetical protein